MENKKTNLNQQNKKLDNTMEPVLNKKNQENVSEEIPLNEENYIVTYKKFRDLEDRSLDPDGYIYKKDDKFPRDGFSVSSDRIDELSSTRNKIGEILIEKMS